METQKQFSEYVSNLEDEYLKYIRSTYPGEGWRIIIIIKMQKDGFTIYDSILDRLDDIIDIYDRRHKRNLRSYISSI